MKEFFKKFKKKNEVSEDNDALEETLTNVTPEQKEVVAVEAPIVHESIEVRLDNLTKEFVQKSKAITVAVKDFSVTIPAGKLIGLLGPSGCGKSTTLYMVAGLHKPNAGKIYFGGEDVTSLPPEKRGIGLVFQNYALYPHMTVRQNIMFPLENMKVAKEEALKRAQYMAELVHIGDLMDRKPNQLSGGQQQRVAIARALVKMPRVLLLDEPLSNLDARLRLQTREEIKRIQRETGITTIFVTHDQEEAMSISDEIVVMNLGLKQQMDHPQTVYDEPINEFVAKFLGNPPINILDGIVKNKKLFMNDIHIEDVNLDDQDVHIGLRPEFFVMDPKGLIEAEIEIVEHIGRDTMLICRLEELDVTFRSIIPASRGLKIGQKIHFSYSKFFVFNKETGERLI